MKQLSLFPELDLSSDEPLQVNPTTNEIFNKFVEKKKESPVRKPNAVPPKTTTIQKYKNGGAAAPKPKPKIRAEHMDERLQRMIYTYDSPAGMKKPAHMDNPNIIDYENLGKKPKPFNNNDPSTYPSDRDQKQKLNSWDIILDTTIKSGTPKEKAEMREYLREKNKDPSQRKYLTKKELKFISAYNEPTKAAPIIPITPLPRFDPPKPRDPQMIEAERRFKQMLEESKREKELNRRTGLAGLLGIE